MKLTLLLLLVPLLLPGCTVPERIDAFGNRAVTSMEVDYDEFVEWASVLTDSMLEDGFLADYRPWPVLMAVSKIENKTSISQIPSEMVVGRIRAGLREDGRVRFVSTYGSDGTDELTRDLRDLTNDPLFDQQQVQEKAPQGTASVSRLSLRTQFLQTRSQNALARQVTYEVRMWITDTRTGEVVWEGFSSPIPKRVDRSKIGL